MASIKPVSDKLAVIIDEVENKTAGGIFLPDTVDKEKPQTGKVVAVGTADEVKENIKVGDRVIFGKYTGTEAKIGSEKYLILKYEDILAVIE